MLDLASPARADHVAGAVLVGAEKRPASMHPLLRDPGSDGLNDDSGPRGLCATPPAAASWWVVVRPIPVTHPLPDVPRDVMEPIAVGEQTTPRARYRRSRRRPRLSIGKLTLVGIGQRPVAVTKVITPGIQLAGEAAAGPPIPTPLRSAAASPPSGGKRHRVVVARCEPAGYWSRPRIGARRPFRGGASPRRADTATTGHGCRVKRRPLSG